MTLAGSCTASRLRHGPSAADSSRPRGRGDGLGQQHTAGLTEPPRRARASQRDGQRTAQRQLRVARQPRTASTSPASSVCTSNSLSPQDVRRARGSAFLRPRDGGVEVAAHDGVAVVAPLLGQKTGHHLYFGVYDDGHTMIPRRAWPREHGSASSRAQMQAQPCLQSKGSAEAAEPV